MKVLVIHGWPNLMRMETVCDGKTACSYGTVQLPPAVDCGVRVAHVVDSKEAIVTSMFAPACTKIYITF